MLLWCELHVPFVFFFLCHLMDYVYPEMLADQFWFAHSFLARFSGHLLGTGIISDGLYKCSSLFGYQH